MLFIGSVLNNRGIPQLITLGGTIYIQNNSHIKINSETTFLTHINIQMSKYNTNKQTLAHESVKACTGILKGV